jgi:hypothetical protein
MFEGDPIYHFKSDTERDAMATRLEEIDAEIDALRNYQFETWWTATGREHRAENGHSLAKVSFIAGAEQSCFSLPCSNPVGWFGIFSTGVLIGLIVSTIMCLLVIPPN